MEATQYRCHRTQFKSMEATGTTAVGASSTQRRQSSTAAIAHSSSQQRQSGTTAIPTSSTQLTHNNYSSDLWFNTTQIRITESDHESDSDFVLNKSDEESSSTTDDDVNVSIDSSEEDHVVDVPGGNLPDIPNPLLMPIHPCMNAILRALRQSKYKGKWFRESVCSLFEHFLCSREKLQKLRHLEMNIIHDELFKFFGKKVFKKTDLKSEKVNSLCRQFCPSIYIDGCSPENSQRQSSTSVASLFSIYKKYLCSDNYPKELLKSVMCQIHNNDHLKEWKDNCPVPVIIEIPEENFEYEIYCYPNFNSMMQELECRSLDPSHVLNNIRSQICRHGYVGVCTKAFHEVSKRNNQIISKNTLVSNMDRQKVGIFVDFFSEEVEKILRELKYSSEADFVRITQKWYQACDECGIPSLQRLHDLKAMQDHLYSKFAYDKTFPPPTKYIDGMPVTTFEAILITISSRFTLYSIAQLGSYNHHAISTLGIESFFSDLTRMEFSRLGTPKSCDIPKLISHLVELNRVKHDPDRGFEFNITKDTVYPYYLMEDADRDNRHPYFDNWFDHKRLRKEHQKWSKISDPFKQDRGVSGVWPDLYRINESKILMEHRAGCEIRFADTRDKI